MKVFKGVIVLGIIMITFLIVIIAVIKKSNSDKYLKIKIEVYAFIHSEFYTRKPFEKPSSKDALIVDFSEKDIKYNDSILSIITSTAIYIPDDLKEWKKTHLIYKKKRYKVKYRFHGSHNGPYKDGKISLKIKSKKYINGARQFVLITNYRESSFINVFLALQEHKLDLVAPDTGSIVLANLNGKVEDFWFTEDLSTDYLKDKYGFENFNVFEVSDNWTRNGGSHFSELDGFYYYLDGDNLEVDSDKYNKYKNFIESINKIEKGDIFPNTDYKYMGRLLANLYFYYNVHHISGDNNKFLYDYTKDVVYPIARNEGNYTKITDILNFDQGMYDSYKRQSPTFNFYKKAVCNDSIKFYRDQELYNLVKNKSNILHELDSIHKKYIFHHKYYNGLYHNVIRRYQFMKEVIRHNSIILMKYLNNGEVIVAYNKKNKSIRIATDYRVPLKVIDIESSEFFILKGVDFRYEEGIIKPVLIENEFTFKNVITRSRLKIINLVTKDTIPNSNIIFNYF